ncbi:UNVERIFIED_CONTAM: hypothetical protein FKN15_052937 [Acipenser sinensis]
MMSLNYLVCLLITLVQDSRADITVDQTPVATSVNQGETVTIKLEGRLVPTPVSLRGPRQCGRGRATPGPPRRANQETRRPTVPGDAATRKLDPATKGPDTNAGCLGPWIEGSDPSAPGRDIGVVVSAVVEVDPLPRPSAMAMLAVVRGTLAAAMLAAAMLTSTLAPPDVQLAGVPTFLTQRSTICHQPALLLLEGRLGPTPVSLRGPRRCGWGRATSGPPRRVNQETRRPTVPGDAATRKLDPATKGPDTNAGCLGAWIEGSDPSAPGRDIGVVVSAVVEVDPLPRPSAMAMLAVVRGTLAAAMLAAAMLTSTLAPPDVQLAGVPTFLTQRSTICHQPALLLWQTVTFVLMAFLYYYYYYYYYCYYYYYIQKPYGSFLI